MGDESAYRDLVKNNVYREENNLLLLNIKKPSNNCRLQKTPPASIAINRTEVMRADSHKFFGFHVTLTMTVNITATVKKLQQQQLYFIMLLRKAEVSIHALTQAYRELMDSILTPGITVWYRNTTQAERKALQRVIKTAEGL